MLSATFAAAFLIAAMMGFQVSIDSEKPKSKFLRILDALNFLSIGSAIAGAVTNWKNLPESRHAAISGLVSLALALLFFYFYGKAD